MLEKITTRKKRSFNKIKSALLLAYQQDKPDFSIIQYNITKTNRSDAFKFLCNEEGLTAKHLKKYEPFLLDMRPEARDPYKKLFKKLSLKVVHRDVDARTIIFLENDYQFNDKHSPRRAHFIEMVKERENLESYFFSYETLYFSLFTGIDIYKNQKFHKKAVDDIVVLSNLKKMLSFYWILTPQKFGNGYIAPKHIAEYYPSPIFDSVGYHVGVISTIDGNGRRLALSRLINMEYQNISNMDSHAKFAIWGEALSITRIKKVKTKIFQLIRSHKNRENADYTQAVSEWTEDLNWLKKNMYDKNVFINIDKREVPRN